MTEEQFNRIKALAQRDDCLTAGDGLTVEDVRLIISQFEAMRHITIRITSAMVEFGQKVEDIDLDRIEGKVR